MRPKTLALLAILVGGLVAFIALYEKKLPSTDERKTQEKKTFLVESDEIVSIELEKGGKTVRLERDAKPKSESDAPSFPPPRDWRLVAPLTAKADRALADRLASDLSTLAISRRLDGVTRKDVGLEPPKGVVRWKSPEREGSLEIGAEVPASSSLVVAASGQKDFLVVGKAIEEHLNRAPGEWRAKEVVAANREDIERIRLVPASGDELVLSRKGERFVVERPYADAADRDAVDPLLSDLVGLKAESFLDAPLSPEATSGLAASAGRIELAVKGRTEPLSIELGAPVTSTTPAPAPAAETGEAIDPTRYVRVAGQAVEAKTKLAETVSRASDAIESWRSKAWTDFDSWKIERIRVEDSVGRLELQRDGGDWRRDGAKIPYTEVGDLLYALTSARADELVAGDAAKALPTSAPSETIVFSDANGVEETLTLHGTLAGRPGIAARVSGRDVVLLLPQRAADEVFAKIASVRAAKPMEEKKVGEEKPVGAAPTTPPPG